MERKIINDGTCEFTWNPGQWPYLTRCSFAQGHGGQHVDGKSRTHSDVPATTPQEILIAVDSVVTILASPDHRGPSLHRDKTRTLAMEWPELAAALASLVFACEKEVPSPLRRALKVMIEEGNKT